MFVMEEVEKTDTGYLYWYVCRLERRSHIELCVKLCPGVRNLRFKRAAIPDAIRRWYLCHHSVALIVHQHQMVVGVAVRSTLQLEICQRCIEHKDCVLSQLEANVGGERIRLRQCTQVRNGRGLKIGKVTQLSTPISS